ncbi:hypothetical protein [Halocatena marina]|uniref:hypothetical protein n=1 Tax=Halocatena marina TaxID=2934937 RepID=UPI00200CEDD5|nr:hypothetical protein [Halocatena marina]
MTHHIKEIVGSIIFTTVAGLILWPPRGNYWAKIFDKFGGGTILTIALFLLSIILGAVFGRATDIQLSNYIIGGIGAYVIGMVGIEIGIDPISPVHFIWYGGLLACLIGGVAASSYI